MATFPFFPPESHFRPPPSRTSFRTSIISRDTRLLDELTSCNFFFFFLKELSFEEIYLDDRLDDIVLTFHAFFPLASHYRTRSIDFYKLLLLVSKADVDRIDELPLSRHEGARRSCLHPCRISNFDGIIGRRFDFRRKT